MLYLMLTYPHSCRKITVDFMCFLSIIEVPHKPEWEKTTPKYKCPLRDFRKRSINISSVPSGR